MADPSSVVHVQCNVQNCDCYIALTTEELHFVKQNAKRVFADANMCARLDGRCMISKRDILLACRMLQMTGANMMMAPDIGSAPVESDPLEAVHTTRLGSDTISR